MSAARRRYAALIAASTLLLGGLAPAPSGAVSADHGNQVVSPDPMRGTPHVMNGSVIAITQVGNKIIAAGTFTSVSPADTFTDTSDDLVRNRIFAFDATTGVIDPAFNPNLGGAANSLDTDGTHVYVGGAFGSVGGKSGFKRVVKLTMTGAPVAEFKAKPGAVVNEVVLRGDRLYIGGAFKNVKSRRVTYPVAHLAALDTVRGTPLTDVLNVKFAGVYNPGAAKPGVTNVKRFDVTADGSRMAVIGNFSSISGQTRNQVAVLDTGGSTVTLSPWFTNRFDRSRSVCAGVFDTFTRDVDFSPVGDHFVITTTGAFAGGANANTLCDTVTRWETGSTSNDPTWTSYTGGDTTYGVAVTGSAVYVGGHQRWHNNPFQADQPGPGSVPREGIAALDPVNGMPLSWNPGRTRGVGAQALLATSQGLWVGSDTTLLNNQRRGRVAFLPLAGGAQVPPTPGQPLLPGDVFGAQQVSPPANLVRRAVDGSGAPTGLPATVDSSDWSTVRGAFLLGDTLYYGSTDNALYRRSFNAATGALGEPSTVNLYNDPDNGARIPFAISSITGMFFDPATHRIYYTVSGDSRLFYRYFTPVSEIVGAQTFTADSGGVSFGAVAGMTLAGGRILYGSSDGSLRSVSFSDGRVTGSPAVLSADGTWRYRALFAPTS